MSVSGHSLGSPVRYRSFVGIASPLAVIRWDRAFVEAVWAVDGMGGMFDGEAEAVVLDVDAAFTII